MTTESDLILIRPVSVNDARMTSTTVPETVAATYSGGTTYTSGAKVGLAPVYGSPQLVYESKSAGNVGNPLPVPPATSTAYWKYVGTVYPAYNSGSSCGVGGIVSNISADVHELYESQVTANTGNPLTDNTKWVRLGSTNARAMFDTTYGSQTEAPESIVTVMTPGTITNALYLGNLDAASVTVSQSVSGWSKTINLNRHPVNSWYRWFYEPLYRQQDVAILDIPPYPASTLTLTISSPGGTAKCGAAVMGKSVILGKTQWGVLGEVVSFSGTSTDGFGNTTFAPRAALKRLNLSVRIRQGFESEAFRLLTKYTDTPMVLIGSSAYEMTLAYGYLGAWKVPVSNSGENAPIEFKSLR